ncbi:MAG: beta-lactamase family protein [Rhodobacteraceae bacterium]|nr:beta-lactamase family protein [Paracoccaceae bacterium]
MAETADPARIETLFRFFDTPSNKASILSVSDETRYAWRHMSNFFPTEQVLRDGPVRQLPERPDPAIARLVVRFADGSVATVDDYFAASTMDAMVVLRGGDVVYERYKSLRPIDKRAWFSCSKIIVGTLMALLEHEGRIDVSKPVSVYLPDLVGSVWDSVLVEAALDMATGLDSTEHEEPDARTNPARGWYRWAASIGLFGDVEARNETPVDVLRGMTRRRAAHEVFEYNSINTYVCQMIIEKLAGLPLAEFFGSRIWRRIGVQGDGYLVVSKQGRALGFGFMNSTLRDLARFGLIFTTDRVAPGEAPILPDAVLARVHSGLRPGMYDKGAFGRVFRKDFPLPGIANRYQWDIVTPDGDQFKAGFAGQGLYVSRPRDSVVAFFSTGTQRDEALAAWVARTITQSFDVATGSARS